MLYYPGSHPPKGILRHAVLYWDHIATITDGQHVQDMRPGLRQVHDAGLYVPIEFAKSGLAAEFEQIFAEGLPELLRTAPVKRLLPELSRHDRIAALPIEQRPDWAHPGSYNASWDTWERFPEPLMIDLVKRGLITVRRDKTISLAPLLRLLLFSAAARAVAARASSAGIPGIRDGLVPHTDQEQAYFATHQHPSSTPPSGPNVHWQGAWQVEIGKLLPAVRNDVPLSRVITFRRRYDDERRRLLLSLRKLTVLLRESGDDPRSAFAEVDRELTAALADYRAAGRSALLRWADRSVLVTVALGAGALGELLVPQLSWVFAVAGGLAVNLATGRTRSYPQVPEVDVTYLHRLRGLTDRAGS